MTKELKQFTLTSVKNIQKAIENNKLVIFVGAGVSKNSGIPTWEELVRELAKDLGIRAKAQNIDGFDYYSADDYLKIPQYYFNEREEREYIDKVKSVLDRNTSPNDIHNIIFDLNPVHIITTNFDNLIEEQYKIKTTTKRYIKVSKDEDLAASPVSNYILKMHGDFENMVLKESDYDSYSLNFQLIENFIKSLFATYTVLFIGFSATDCNVRRILQWVKDIIGTKHQPAYLIDVNNYKNLSEEEFRIKHDYYKKQGIFTLYYTQIESEIEQVCEPITEKISLKSQGADLYKFLYFIKNYKSFDVDKYYKALYELKSLNVITNDVLSKIFNTQIPNRLIDNAYRPLESEQQKYEIDTFRLKSAFLNNDNIENIKLNLQLLKGNCRLTVEQQKRINKYNTNKEFSAKDIEDIKQFLSNLEQIFTISSEDIKKIEYIWEAINNAQKYTTEIISNDYDYVNNTNTNHNKINVDIFKNAQQLYNKGEYVQAYQELSNISKTYKYDAIIYYIAEFNKKTISGNIKWETAIKKHSKTEEEIAQEYDKINLQNILNFEIPESIKPIVELFTIENMERKYLRFIELTNKIEAYKKTLQTGGSGFNNYSFDLSKEFYQLFNFMLGNYLFVNKYSQTVTLLKLITKALIESYTTEQFGKPFINFGISKIETFKLCDLILIINYLPNKDFKEILANTNLKTLKVQNKEDIIRTLIEKFKLFIQELPQYNKPNLNNIISNYLTIFELLELNQDEFKEVIDTYILFTNLYINNSLKLDGHNFRGLIHKKLSHFIIMTTLRFINNKINLDNNIYENVINVYKNIRTLSTYDYNKLILNCIEALKQSKNYKLQKQDIIEFYINNENPTKDIDEIIANLYFIADGIHKKQIKQYFSKTKYKKITTNNSDLIYCLVDYKIIRFTKEIENSLFLQLEDSIKEKLITMNERESSIDPLIQLLVCLFNFIKIEKIKNKAKINNIIHKLAKISYMTEENKNEFDQIIRLINIYTNPIEYDYSKAKFKDIQYLNDTVINVLKNNDNNIIKIAMLLLQEKNTIEDEVLKEKLEKIFEINSNKMTK